MFDFLIEILKFIKPNKKETNQWWNWTKKAIGYISNSSAVALEMMWRKDFGGQYLSHQATGASIMVFVVIALLCTFSGEGQVLIADRTLAVVLCIVTFINVARHQSNITNAKNSNVQRHGMDSGISIFPQILKISEFRAKLVIEPMINVGLSFVFSLLGATLISTVILFGAVLAGWHEFQLQNKLQQTYNNILNSRIDAQRMKQMSKGGIQGYYQNTNQQSSATGKVKHPNPKSHDAIRSK